MSVLITVLFFVCPVLVVALFLYTVMLRKRIVSCETEFAEIAKRVRRADLASLIATQTGVNVDDVAVKDLDRYLDV